MAEIGKLKATADLPDEPALVRAMPPWRNKFLARALPDDADIRHLPHMRTI